MTEQHQYFVDAHPNVPRKVLQAELARLLYAGIPLSLAVNALIATILATVQHNVLSIEPILVWCTLLGATLVLRAVFTVTYRHAQMGELVSETALTRFRIGAAATGIAWGLASFILFPANDVTYQSFLILAIAGMTAGAVASLSADLVSSLAFIIPALVPLIARVLAEGGEIHFALGVMGVLFLIALILNARRTSFNTRENICLRLEAVGREHDLHESEERLRLIMGTMEEVFWMADVPIERMLYISPAYERIWGRTTESLYENPRSFIESVHPEDVQRVLSDLEAEKTGQPFDHEYRVVRPDGATRWVWDRGFPVRDETGKVTRYAGIAQDVTERKRMEQELRRNEEHLNLAQAIGQIGSWVLDIPTSRLEWSAETYRMFGIPPQKAINQGIFVAATHPDDRDSVMNAWGDAMAGDNLFDIEHRIVVGGQTRWVRERAKVERDSEGRPLTGIGTVQDITERKRMEQEILRINAGLEDRVRERTKELEEQITARISIENELMQVKERYDFATMIGKVGTWDWNPVTGVLYWSDETFRLMGFTPGSFIPSYELYLSLVHPDDRELLNSCVQVALHERKPYDLDCRIVLGSGKELVCHATGNVEYDAKGQPIRMLGTIQDITERKNIETSLRESERHLRQAQSIAHIGSWDYDIALGQLKWSDELYRIYGVSPEFFSPENESLIKLIHRDDQHAMLAWIDSCVSGQKSGAMEFRCIWPDGTIRYIEGQGDLTLDAEGKPAHVSGTARDITEQKRAEYALLENEAKLRAYLSNISDVIMLINASLNIIYLSPSATNLLGLLPEELTGQQAGLFIHPDDMGVIATAMSYVIEHPGEPHTIQHRVRHKDGRWIHVETTGVNMTGNPAVNGVLTVMRDITERKKAEEEIHRLAFFDALTNLPNRRLFFDRLSKALIASERHNNFGAVLFIDMDRLKLLNDTLGHDYGDLLLVEVAFRIKACVREMDTVARLGGDEFVVLIEGVSDEQLEASHKIGLVAEKIRESLAHPYDLNGNEYHSSPSIGVSLYRGNGITVDELLQHADMAMYQAKDAGRNAVRFFDPVMQNNVTTRAALVNDLRKAIAQRQLHLHYQLQVNNDRSPMGAEALLRWIHPQRGVVMPEQFLPVAEESTLILEIGDWVLGAACRQLALWSANEKFHNLVLTININAKQFSLPDFVDKVGNALQMHQINPAKLKLELTENMALDDLPSVVEKMHALKALGVCLSMDDFGTRFLSLSYIKQLPLDQIKLGRRFVKDITNDGNVALLVQSIIDLSSKCRLTVIAEGVENEAQLASLRDRDCVAYQGFLFSNALSIEEFEQLLS